VLGGGRTQLCPAPFEERVGGPKNLCRRALVHGRGGSRLHCPGAWGRRRAIQLRQVHQMGLRTVRRELRAAGVAGGAIRRQTPLGGRAQVLLLHGCERQFIHENAHMRCQLVHIQHWARKSRRALLGDGGFHGNLCVALVPALGALPATCRAIRLLALACVRGCLDNGASPGVMISKRALTRQRRVHCAAKKSGSHPKA